MIKGHKIFEVTYDYGVCIRFNIGIWTSMNISVIIDEKLRGCEKGEHLFLIAFLESLGLIEYFSIGKKYIYIFLKVKKNEK